MTLRNPTDLARQATEASTLQFLLSQYNIPIPAKLPYAMQPAFDLKYDPLKTQLLPNDIVPVTP
jgi:pilus assembly protein CpaB